ncbi:hypothetical protein ACPFP2_11140 [Micromonospora citrea]|uniref:hypothetical protein n=1 Tax=Micromonospora citrea TaxID=47855 RepID=UPI003C32B852
MSKSLSRSIRAGLLGIVLLVAGAGCGAAGAPRTDPSAEPRVGPTLSLVDLTKFSLPLDRFVLSPVNLTLSTRAEFILTDDCMKRFGLALPPQVASGDPSMNYSRRYGIFDEALAAKRGYRGPADSGPKVTPLTPQAEAVATGQGQRSYAGKQVPEGGCVGEARRVLMEGVREVPARDLGSVLANESWERSKQDSRVRAVFTSWSSCMKLKGYDYADPMAAVGNPVFGTKEPSPEEIKVAVADVRCKREANVVNVWATVETAYQEMALKQHSKELAAIRAHFEAQERNAEKIIAGRG